MWKSADVSSKSPLSEQMMKGFHFHSKYQPIITYLAVLFAFEMKFVSSLEAKYQVTGYCGFHKTFADSFPKFFFVIYFSTNSVRESQDY